MGTRFADGRGHVSDDEILSMTAFALRACARRIQRLAQQAGDAPPSERLTAAAEFVLQLEAQLRTVELPPRPLDKSGE